MAQLRHAVREAVRVERPDPTELEVDELTFEITKRLNGPMLDLRELYCEDAAVFRHLPASGWQALRDLARASGAEITDVLFPDADPRVPWTAPPFERMACLAQSLVGMSIAVSPADGYRRAEFPELARFPRLEELNVRCASNSVLRIGVRRGVRVTTTALGRVSAPEKSWVFHIDGKGRPTGERLPLPGLVYERQATDFGHRHPAPILGLDMEAQKIAAKINLNCMAKRPNGAEIVCADLALQWAMDQAQRGPHSPRFSYANYRSLDAIAAHVVHERGEFARLAWKGHDIYAERFGEYVAHELRQMQVGERRFFIVAGSKHGLGVKISVKVRRGRKVFAVCVYDPNRTCSHHRAAFDSANAMRNLPLASWLRSPLATHDGVIRIARYVPAQSQAPLAPAADLKSSSQSPAE